MRGLVRRLLTMHLFSRIWAHPLFLSLRFHVPWIIELSIVELLLLVHPIRVGHKLLLASSILKLLKALRPISAPSVLTHEYLFYFFNLIINFI